MAFSASTQVSTAQLMATVQNQLYFNISVLSSVIYLHLFYLHIFIHSYVY
jgi:hypothetical protein